MDEPAEEVDRSPEAFLKYSDEFAKLGYRWDWSGFPMPDGRHRVMFLDAYPDAVVTLDTATKLTVMEPNTGKVRWANETANPLAKIVGSTRDRNYFGGTRLVAATESEAFVLDMQTGNLLSRQRFEKVVNTRPLLYGSAAIVGTPTGEVMAHGLQQNVKLWGFDVPGAIESNPVLLEGVVGAVSQAGEVVFVSTSGGSLLGRNRMFAGITTDPVAAGGLMIVAGGDQSLYAFSPGGQIAWRKRTSRPLVDQPTVRGTDLYCTTADDGLTCFEAATGAVKWSNKNVTGSVIAARKGRLLVWNGRTMTTVDPGTGLMLERAELPDVAEFAFDAFEDGNMYVLNRGGVVGKFVPRS